MRARLLDLMVRNAVASISLFLAVFGLLFGLDSSLAWFNSSFWRAVNLLFGCGLGLFVRSVSYRPTTADEVPVSLVIGPKRTSAVAACEAPPCRPVLEVHQNLLPLRLSVLPLGVPREKLR
jgi:hypothetical protein